MGKLTPMPLPDDAYTPLLSRRAKNLKGNPIRDLLPMENAPGMLSLLAGKPNPSTFPLTSLSFTTQHPSGEQVQLSLDGDALHEAMQYNMIQGMPALIDWITGLQELVHQRHRDEGWSVSIGVGSADLIQKCINGLFDPGDSIMIETPGYPGLIPLLHSMEIECIEIPSDGQGIQSHIIDSLLTDWPDGKSKPKALYTVPVGSNPSGCTTILSRRQETLLQAQKHNFLILEDDPYFYLYYSDDPRPPSYFALELQTGSAGRVIRFDSFSKILSSGFRLGFVTGPSQIVGVINAQTALSNLQPSTFIQSLVLALLRSWGYEIFLAHTQKVSEFYRQKRDIFVAALERHLSSLASWHVPGAGMFIWLNLHIPPNANGQVDSRQLIREDAMRVGVLALPGIVASPLGLNSSYCRVSFSLLSEEQADESCKRLAKAIRHARMETNGI